MSVWCWRWAVRPSLPVLRSIGVDRDTVASGRAPTAPGLGREGIADTAKDGKETTAAKWMAQPFYTPMKWYDLILYCVYINTLWLVMLLTGTVWTGAETDGWGNRRRAGGRTVGLQGVVQRWVNCWSADVFIHCKYLRKPVNITNVKMFQFICTYWCYLHYICYRSIALLSLLSHMQSCTFLWLTSNSFHTHYNFFPLSPELTPRLLIRNELHFASEQL